MKRLINVANQRIIATILVLLLLVMTKAFSQVLNPPRSLTIESTSANSINIKMVDDYANTNYTIFVEKSVNGGAYSAEGSFISQPSQPTPSYLVTGLTQTTPYCFRVRTRTSTGTYSAYSAVACATTNPVQVPSGFTVVTTGQTSAQVTWSNYGGKDSDHRIYIERSNGNGGAFTQIGDVFADINSSFNDTGLSPGTQYCYRIKGRREGQISSYTSAVCVATQQGAPNAPSNLTATAQDGYKIYLHWDDNANNESGFIVERSTDNVNFTLLTPLLSNAIQLIDGPLTPSTTYYYRVKAYTGALSSAYTNVASATTFPSPPVAPEFLKATTASSSQINLTWRDVSNNESGFELERSTDGTNFSKIADIGANAISYENAGLNPLTKYWYRIRAKNSGGNSGYSNVTDATTLDNAPGTPQNLNASAVSNTQINLNWNDNSGNETGFELERSTDGTNFIKLADLPANATSYQNTGLATLTKYWYRIRAKNEIGNSGYSNVAETTTFDVPPVAPTDLTAMTISASQIDLVWKDNSGNESGFDIERSTDGSNFAKVGETGANATTFSSNDLAPATKYLYRVRSKNSQGGSTYTNVAEATTKDVVPNAPQNLSGMPSSNTQINLSWNNNSGNETGFELERSTDGINFVKLVDLPANSTSYENTGLTTLTKYWYRIRAKNAIGNSGYSNVAETTTFDVPPTSPESLTATTISSSQVNLAWKDLSANETGFQMERSTDGINFSKIADLGANTITFQNTGLAPATKYWYRVRAVNTANPSAFSNVANATTIDVVPLAPESLAATAISYGQIDLSWTDKSGNEAGFLIERSTDGINFTKTADVVSNSSFFQDKGVASQTQYFYRIRATNAIGPSAYSNVAIATTPVAPIPDKPQNLKAVPVDFDLIQLSWSALSANATGVVIERSTKPDQGFVQIGNQAASIIQFPDHEILDINDYYYRVKAVNLAGSSAYSDVAKISASAIITGTEPVADQSLIYAFNNVLYVKRTFSSKASLRIFDASGVGVIEFPVLQTFQIELKGLKTGIYIVVIESEKELVKQKILIN